jgi:hypothetical protein
VVTSRADKDTIRVALDLGDSGLVYAPGDALGIYPVNNLQVKKAGLAARGGAGRRGCSSVTGLAAGCRPWTYSSRPPR